ncbi:hypothetical protein ARUE_c17510 [Arthrobacter sp. Rue61a]|nr:hypothetical protein ARUE_c17510 [Arthrobacter sp. Rue61a]
MRTNQASQGKPEAQGCSRWAHRPRQAGKIQAMSSYAELMVGDLPVLVFRNGVPPHVLALFRDDWLVHVEGVNDDRFMEPVDSFQYMVGAQDLVLRLETLGIHASAVARKFDETVESRRGFLHELLTSWLESDPTAAEDCLKEIRFLDRLTIEEWGQMLRTSVPGVDAAMTGSRGWLLSLLQEWDTRQTLMACLMAEPKSIVSLDLTAVEFAGYLDGELSSLASRSLADIRSNTLIDSPLIVLTEGKTDSEFLSTALEVLYPNLTDLVKFLDFEQKPEGGAGALVKTIKAFSSAGVANRVVAIFDNDTAASAALRHLDFAALPANVKVLQYPDIALASSYPTLGPPTWESPQGAIAIADVNGFACSLELYLGADVLKSKDGSFYPVRWSSFVSGPNQYQGEVSAKAEIHAAFRSKVSRALEQREALIEEDWTNLSEILAAIITAFSPVH